MNAVAEAVTEMPSPFVFTDNAVGKVRELMEEEGNPELKLRVFVTGGGCSGFQYGFTFDELQNEDDTVAGFILNINCNAFTSAPVIPIRRFLVRFAQLLPEVCANAGEARRVAAIARSVTSFRRSIE